MLHLRTKLNHARPSREGQQGVRAHSTAHSTGHRTGTLPVYYVSWREIAHPLGPVLSGYPSGSVPVLSVRWLVFLVWIIHFSTPTLGFSYGERGSFLNK